ncbi:MAG: hypothetical protein N3D16_11190 [Anaerolineales bacterium]|nr:hypothetical protein [Anaerolineales bacterium]
MRIPKLLLIEGICPCVSGGRGRPPSVTLVSVCVNRNGRRLRLQTWRQRMGCE